jgi:uncharacterized protein DUF4238
MAGIRHHILPRFLLKGFASKVVGHEVFTWVYRKEGKVFEANIVNVGVEKHFYGKEGELNVDDEITDVERSFAILLDELRRKDNVYEIRDPKMAEFVGHLSGRTKHLRDSLIDTTGVLTTILTGYLADRNNFRSWILEYYKRHPEVMKKALDDALGKMQLTRHQRLLLKQRMLMILRPELVVAQMDKDIAQYAFMFSALGPMLLEKLPTIAKESHIKALAKSLIPEPRVEDYRKLNWFVYKSSEPLILGDVGCLFEVAGKKNFISLSSKEDDLKNIFLPISADTLVVGTVSATIPQIDFKAINENFAKSSREFFVYREPSPETQRLFTILSTEAEIFSKDEIEQLVKEVILEG